MKYAVASILAMVSISASAADRAVGGSWFYKGQTPAQVVVNGYTAEAIYKSLKNVKENQIIEEHTGMPYGSYKNGSDVSCSQTNESYECTIFLDESGAIAHKSF